MTAPILRPTPPAASSSIVAESRTGQRAAAEVSGPVLFARYAFPPNHHGYCGPADNEAFFQQGVSGGDDGGLRAMAKEFAGAWPYLELIAHSSGLADPLDRRVVEAYWVGSPRLDQLGIPAIANSMEDRFRFKSGPRFSSLAEGVLAGGVPHHSFAVFCIYPWVGLLGDDRRASQALTVLDRCRIRWGRVLSLDGDQVVVESAPSPGTGAGWTTGHHRPRRSSARSVGWAWSRSSRWATGCRCTGSGCATR
ncbi:MAG: DUF6390 family protein [Nocardioidaceae bacterium]